MKFELLTIGKTKIGYVEQGLKEYLNRLKRYIPFTLTELPDIKNAGKLSEEEQKEMEGTAILNTISPSDYVILLDERGVQYSSREFAKRLQLVMASGKKRLIMVIGGPYGFSKDIYKRADEMLSLSKMTFNHEMVRLFIVEQTYRAMTILRGEPYHHGD